MKIPKVTYPLLEKDDSVMKQYDVVEKQRNALTTSIATLASFIKDVQNRCPHPSFNKVIEKLLGKPVLTMKICEECGYEKGKPAGTRFEVCPLCWSPMGRMTKDPRGEIRETFICQDANCKNEEFRYRY